MGDLDWHAGWRASLVFFKGILLNVQQKFRVLVQAKKGLGVDVEGFYTRAMTSVLAAPLSQVSELDWDSGIEDESYCRNQHQ